MFSFFFSCICLPSWWNKRIYHAYSIWSIFINDSTHVQLYTDRGIFMFSKQFATMLLSTLIILTVLKACIMTMCGLNFRALLNQFYNHDRAPCSYHNIMLLKRNLKLHQTFEVWAFIYYFDLWTIQYMWIPPWPIFFVSTIFSHYKLQQTLHTLPI